MNKIQPPSSDRAVNERRRKAKIYCDANRARRRQLNRDWIRNNRSRYNAAKARYRLRLKIRSMALYADPVACQSCGFSKIDGLVIDHINNDGAAHRIALRLSHRGSLFSGSRIYERINQLGKLAGLQVLCANCNMIKQIRLCRAKSISNPELLSEIEVLCGY